MKTLKQLASLCLMGIFIPIVFTSCPDEIKPHEHQWGEWRSITRQPTCEAAGYGTRACACGEVHSDHTIPALGHDLEWDVTDARPEVLLTYTCQRTGCTHTEESGPLAEITFTSVRDLGLILYKLPPFNTKANPYTLVFNLSDLGGASYTAGSFGHALYYSTKYISLDLSGSTFTSIGDLAFYGCSSLASVTIPSGVTSIGHEAFYGCSSLASVSIPSGVTSIGDLAFYGCSSLASVSIPSGVTSIGGYAFRDCTSLASVSIPSGVTSIGSYAFYGCSSLASVTFEGTIPSGGFSNYTAYGYTFPGDLRDKFYATDASNGTPGTYTTTNPGSSAVWTKQP